MKQIDIMQKELHIIDGIYDILAPVPPENSIATVFVFLLLISMASIVLVIVWRYRFSQRGIAHHQLKLLHTTILKTESVDKVAIFELSTILREGLGLTQIGTAILLPKKIRHHTEQWQIFVTKLNVARYTAKSNNLPQLHSLIQDAQFWLKIWP